MRNLEAYVNELLNAVPHALVVSDEDGVIEFANRHAEALLGYGPGELLGRSVDAFLPAEMRAAHEGQRAAFLKARGQRMLGTHRKLAAVRKDGTRMLLMIGLSVWESDSGTRVVVALLDAGPRWAAEERAHAERQAAAEVAEFGEAIIRDASLGIVIYEADSGQCVSANASAERITGVPVPTLLSQRFREIASWPKDTMLRAAEETLATNSMRQIDVSFTTTAGRDVALQCEFLSVRLRGRQHLVLMMADLTERRNLEAQLFAAQKMEAIGQLAGGVAHDFNNLLTVIGTYSTLMLEDCAPGDPRREDLEEIFGAAQRAASLTRQLLAFGRRQVLDPRAIDLNACVAGLSKMLRRVLSAEIDLEIVPGDDLKAVYGDVGQIEQSVMNLVVNARDAMPQGGRIRIVTENVVTAPDSDDPGRPRDARPMVVLRVSDTGVGMDEATLAKVFDPFFTTKDPGRGSGLGLSTTYGIVRQTGGFVRVTSQPGKGSEFSLFFPAYHREADRTPDVPSRPTAPGRVDARILVAEDDEHVRRIVVETLRNLGADVVEVADGADGVLVSEAMPTAPDLLVTDIIMPRLDGVGLAAAMRSRWPDLRVVFMTAYAVDHSSGMPMSELPGTLLRKPFIPSELAAAVRRALR